MVVSLEWLTKMRQITVFAERAKVRELTFFAITEAITTTSIVAMK